MDMSRFAVMTHILGSVPSRRDGLRGLVGAGLGRGGVRLSNVATAGKRRKRKKKIKRNDFGCVNIGGFCKNAAQCCAGICNGKKGKRKCRAHGTANCDQDAPGVCTAPNPIQTACHNRDDCACFTTTAGSSFCAELFCGIPGCSECADCRRDADCVALGFPTGSACARVTQGICAGQCETGMACLLPCAEEPPEPPEASGLSAGGGAPSAIGMR